MQRVRRLYGDHRVRHCVLLPGVLRRGVVVILEGRRYRHEGGQDGEDARAGHGERRESFLGS